MIDLIVKAVDKYGKITLLPACNGRLDKAIMQIGNQLIFQFNYSKYCDYEGKITDDWTGSVSMEV